MQSLSKQIYNMQISTAIWTPRQQWLVWFSEWRERTIVFSGFFWQIRIFDYIWSIEQLDGRKLNLLLVFIAFYNKNTIIASERKVCKWKTKKIYMYFNCPHWRPWCSRILQYSVIEKENNGSIENFQNTLIDWFCVQFYRNFIKIDSKAMGS